MAKFLKETGVNSGSGRGKDGFWKENTQNDANIQRSS